MSDMPTTPDDLRREANRLHDLGEIPSAFHGHYAGLLTEAAERIERLEVALGRVVVERDALRAEVTRLRADPRLALTPSDLTLLLNAAWETCQRDDAKGEPHVPTGAAVARLRAAVAALEGNE